MFTFWVYILYSHKDRNLYVGQTNNLQERLFRHEKGHIQATAHRRPLECIHVEKFATRIESMHREKFLKSLWSSRFKKKLKENFESSRK